MRATYWVLPALLILSMSVTVLATGCSARTPEQTVAGFFKAVQDGNYNKAKTYISINMSEKAGDEADFREMSESPNPEMGENPWGNEADLVSEITGANVVT